MCKQFQSALPRRERPYVRNTPLFLETYFNPRSREGSDLCMVNIKLFLVISIRAPAKGATSSGIHLYDSRNISIRAPAKGATFCNNGSANYCSISIRAPAKGATVTFTHNGEVSGISIRAPAKGATQAITQLEIKTSISIRAPAKGATAILYNNFHFFV